MIPVDRQPWHCLSSIPVHKPSWQLGCRELPRKLHELSPHHYGRRTAERLVGLAQQSVSSGLAISARSTSLRILCDQLEHTQANLAQLEEEIDKLLSTDPKAKGLCSVPEFGPKTVAVLRAELGDVNRFHRRDQVVAYAGLDIEVKESGKWKGKAMRILARQWTTSTHTLHGGSPLRPLGRLALWSVLSSFSSARHEEGHGFDGRHAQNAGGSDTPSQD